jgi:hypothetical protein
MGRIRGLVSAATERRAGIGYSCVSNRKERGRIRPLIRAADTVAVDTVSGGRIGYSCISNTRGNLECNKHNLTSAGA